MQTELCLLLLFDDSLLPSSTCYTRPFMTWPLPAFLALSLATTPSSRLHSRPAERAPYTFLETPHPHVLLPLPRKVPHSPPQHCIWLPPAPALEFPKHYCQKLALTPTECVPNPTTGLPLTKALQSLCLHSGEETVTR